MITVKQFLKGYTEELKYLALALPYLVKIEVCYPNYDK